MDPRTAALIWQDDGTPRSAQFDDPYFSAEGGLNESQHVFLTGNNLPARFTKGFHIAELGFGTGLNMLAAWRGWQQSDAEGPLHFTSFEAFPLALPDMEKALSHWPELAPLAAPLLAAWPCTTLRLPSLHFELITGDARTTLPAWHGKANAWFLDGFSPSKNPEMWSENLMHAVGQHTAPKGSFATYTAAGHVRRTLAAAGFSVTRAQGFGRKRHMSIGQFDTA
ncbi:MAG: tRNA (5-methylaminomethyl-2-thiouridine)(34)-methyltransferase MnmD [Rhodobacteraceae bacterium]|nr:tRNA (5-methylaminomethyl-2-thiouridine)(34)-methyltransferase MnmD [Paracoccaceae bacterium]